MSEGERCVARAVARRRRWRAYRTRAGCITVERPEARGRQTVRQNKCVDRVNVLKRGDLVLRISLADILREPDVLERDTGLLVEGLRGGNGRLSHIALGIYDHAVVGAG